MTPSAMVPRAEGFVVIVPTSMTVVLALLAAVPLHIPGYMAVVPAFTLMGVFHWTVYRPELLPPTIIFAIGVLLDLLTGARYPGISPLVLLIGRAVVIRQRRFFVGRPFAFVWGGFALLAAATIALLWALNSALESALLDVSLAGFRWVLSVALFPPVSYLMVRMQRALLPG